MRFGWLMLAVNVVWGCVTVSAAVAVARGWAPPSALVLVVFAVSGGCAVVDALETFAVARRGAR